MKETRLKVAISNQASLQIDRQYACLRNFSSDKLNIPKMVTRMQQHSFECALSPLLLISARKQVLVLVFLFWASAKT